MDCKRHDNSRGDNLGGSPSRKVLNFECLYICAFNVFFNVFVCVCGNYNAKPKLAFLCKYLESSHFIKAIIFNNFSLKTVIAQCLTLSVDKHGSVKFYPTP